MKRAAVLLGLAGAGWLAARAFGLDGVAHSPVYAWLITALLGVGLYAAAFGIDLGEARAHLRTVLLAVTVGVIAKVAVIAVVVVGFYGDPRMLLLAVAVAQIDPLSVAALRSRSRLSPSGVTLLSAWASFDDPVTVLLTAYLAGFVLPVEGDAGLGALDTGLGPFLLNLALNALLAVVVIAAWRGFLWWKARERPLSPRLRQAGRVVAALLVLAVAVFAVSQALLLALAVIGLFVRPRIDAVIDRVALVALYSATFAIGMVVVVDRVTALTGVVLGAAAFFAQFLIALVLPARGLSTSDRVSLAFAQQNGLTAIVLALLLEPVYPGAAGIIAFAVLVINATHAGIGLLRGPDVADPPPVLPPPRLRSVLRRRSAQRP
ncbi:hypothetical protein ACFQV2_29835 [Actinokineospora soli]|uniref:NhaP-type Na+/H+ or K+/H+ antiporter n=1 Tax=Actinokineospora soli TaxID=1048753 RepID=A0ABW2TVN8_9PSEU